MLEKVIENELRLFYKETGGQCLKFVSPGVRGVPDRICIDKCGKIQFVETKCETGRLSPEQKIIRGLFEKVNTEIIYIRSIQDLIEFVGLQGYPNYGKRLRSKYGIQTT